MYEDGDGVYIVVMVEIRCTGSGSIICLYALPLCCFMFASVNRIIRNIAIDYFFFS